MRPAAGSPGGHRAPDGGAVIALARTPLGRAVLTLASVGLVLVGSWLLSLAIT